jgi:hypothetical protein
VIFTLDPARLSEVDEAGVRAVEPGSYSVVVGNMESKFAITGAATNLP